MNATTIRYSGHMNATNLSKDHLETLLAVLSNPLVDGMELAAITARSNRTTYRHLKTLADAGLTAHFNRGTLVLAASRRHFPTKSGISCAADSLGILRSEVIRRYPVSKQWLDILLQRFDTVATTYRFAAALAHGDETVRPLTVEFRRSGAYDAIVTLNDGRTIGLVRQGLLGPRRSIQWRMRSLNKQSPQSGPANAVVLSPTAWDANVNTSYIHKGEGPRTHVLVETEPLLHGQDAGEQAQAKISGNSKWSTVDYLVKRGISNSVLPVSASPSRKRSTIPDPEEMVAAQAGSGLSRLQARAFSAVAQWPGISRQDLMSQLGAKTVHTSRIMGQLTSDGLVHNLGTRADIRYAPTELGIRYWAQADRTYVEHALGKWMSAGSNPGEWKGTLISKLLGREREHTAGLYWIVSHMAEEARTRDDATLEWVLPTHRAVRYFQQDGRTSVRPDALGALRIGERLVPFMLEFERRGASSKGCGRAPHAVQALL